MDLGVMKHQGIQPALSSPSFGIGSQEGPEETASSLNNEFQALTGSQNEDPDGITLTDSAMGMIEENANPAAEISDIGVSPPDKATMKQVKNVISHYAKKYGINENLLRAVCWQESKWNPKAKSYDGGHGKGVMQIDSRSKDIAKITKEMGVPKFQWSKKVWDPWANVDVGAKYLKSLLTKYNNNWNKALKHYNGSWNYPPKVRDHINKQPWNKYM